MIKPSEAEIRIHAFQLWKEAGEPDGHANDFWDKAEKALIEGRTNQGEVPPGMTDNLPV